MAACHPPLGSATCPHPSPAWEVWEDVFYLPHFGQRYLTSWVFSCSAYLPLRVGLRPLCSVARSRMENRDLLATFLSVCIIGHHSLRHWIVRAWKRWLSVEDGEAQGKDYCLALERPG